MAFSFPGPKPKVPDLEDRLPFIWRQFVDPCDAPITVWLQAMWPALLHAIIAWYAIDLIQIFRTMWKPPLWGMRFRGSRHKAPSGPSKKKGFKKRFKDIITFDVNDWVGHALNPFETGEMIELLPGEIWFWTGIDLIVIGAFYYSVIDITTEFLFEWTAAVAATRYCHARDDAVLLASAPGYELLGIFGWDPMGILDPVKMRNITFFNGYGVAQEISHGMVGMAFGFKEEGSTVPDPWIESRLTCLTGPRAGSYQERRLASGTGASGTGGSTYDMGQGEVWIGEIRCNGRWLIQNPQLWCQARAS